MRKLLILLLVTATVFSSNALGEGFLDGIFSFFGPKTYTITYYVDGVEYFPKYEASLEGIIFYQMLGLMNEEQAAEQLAELSKLTDEEKRCVYEKGQEIIDYAPPAREDCIASWDIQLPPIMDGKDYTLNAVYSSAEYRLEFVVYDAILGVYVPVERIILKSGETITQDMIPEVPEEYAGEYEWDLTALPEGMPVGNVQIQLVKITGN